MTGPHSDDAPAAPAAPTARAAASPPVVPDPRDRPRQPRRVHFLGIGGAGLSPLAQIHLAAGGQVSGSDQEDSPRVAMLRELGVPVRVGPAADAAALAAELSAADVVVASSALRDDHPEIVAARELGVPVRRRSDWLPELTAPYRLVAVAGSHGKTTTAAMLTLVLAAGGADPTAVIGADVAQLGGSAVAGRGEVFVLEADEYGGAFAGLDPELAIITNVEWEHPDLFPDEASVRAVFADFAARVRPGGRLVVCGDHPGVTAVLAELDRRPAPGERAGAARARVVDYGFAPGRTWRAVDYVPLPGGGSTSTVLRDGKRVGELTLALPGPHIALDALAALATATELGVPPADALRTLGTYAGASRRFDVVGRASAPGGTRVEIVDDYAHHPTEIRATLRAARDRAAGRQVWAVAQPHTFSRLAALLDDFATAFGDADRVYVTDVYAARETDDLGLHASDLAGRISRPAVAGYVAWPDLPGRLVADLTEIGDLAAGASAGGGGDPGGPAADGTHGVMLLTLGAGTITTLGPRLLDLLTAGGTEALSGSNRAGDQDATGLPA
ncbi:UDP-N-acetylmuramate--L-alanine ligase [Parafrankia discariae]|uniref:UDP-N-acetylmuramate--L-alanine ligase n=1 Tax=Parafrankia discariae TaxID=365528 RepID=UPI00035F3B70|nr:UDP-N-acetylmuramate--L-alanine ligase [Parafrankia discariae]